MQSQPIWLEERDAISIHNRVLAQHGGAPGLRDVGLLQSAIARPRQYYTYDATTDIVHLAALCTAAIIRNHPFIDGNKRTGFVLGVLFLELNGQVFTAPENAATAAVLALAAGDLTDQGYAAFLAAHAVHDVPPA